MPETRRPLQVAVISHLYPSRARESYGVFVYEQCRALVAAGSTLTAIAVPVPWAPWPLSNLSETWRRYAETERQRLDFGGVRVEFPRYLSFPRKAMRDRSAQTALKAIKASQALFDALSASDVIVAHTALLDGAVARDLADDLGIPYVVFVHGEDLFQNASAKKPRLRAMVRGVLLGARTVIAVSELVREGLVQEFPELQRIDVLPNGVDIELFHPGVGIEHADGPVRILSAGRLVVGKGHEFVLRALADLTDEGFDIRYTIAGDGPLRAPLEARARGLGLADRVTFTGAYRHEDLPAMLRESDLFVLPSWPEAFGVVYLESLASGVPVVAAQAGGARSFVSIDVDGYLVQQGDSGDVCRAIRAFVNLSPSQRQSMRAAARLKATQFTWQRNANDLAGILADVTTPPLTPISCITQGDTPCV